MHYKPDPHYWECQITARGYEVWLPRKPSKMPVKTPKHWNEIIVYIYPSHQAALDGEEFGASGFLIGIQSEIPSQREYLYVVTNAHVVRGAFGQGGGLHLRINIKAGGYEIIKTVEKQWQPHLSGDDVSVIPINLPSGKFRTRYIPTKYLVSQNDMKKFDFGQGDEVFMIGRFRFAGGQIENMPSVRWGVISKLPDPDDRIKMPDTGFMQEAFLMEMHSIPGYSGSPVYWYIDPQIKGRPGITPADVQELGGHGGIIGIDCGHLPEVAYITDGQGNRHPDNWQVKLNSGMAIVVPAWKILEVLEMEDLRKPREEEEKRRKKQAEESPVVLDSAVSEDGITEAEFDSALEKAFKPDKEQTSGEEKSET